MGSPKANNIAGRESLKPSKGESSGSDHQPFLICGPDGPRLKNVTFVSPTSNKRAGDGQGSSYGGVSSSSQSKVSVGPTVLGCVRNPAGEKCQSLLANFLTTCGAIVTHGYHIDSKSSSKEKRSAFGKMADESIAEFAPQENENNDAVEAMAANDDGDGLNDSFAANAKKIFNAGNNMINTLPKDFQNLTQSAAYHNVFDTFQKYYEPGDEPAEHKKGKPVLSDDAINFRETLKNDPDEIEASKEEQNKQQQQVKSKEATNEVQSKQETPKSPILVQRELFKKLRRRRNRSSQSPIRRSNSEPQCTLSPISQKSKSDKESSLENSFENFKERYSRNLHTKVFSEKAGTDDDMGEPKDPKKQNEDGKDVGTTREEVSKDANESSNNSMYSWATPKSREEDDEQEKYPAPVEPSHTLEKRSSTVALIENGNLEESNEKLSEEVVPSTSSGMSDSLVGSDVDDEERLDCLVNSLNSSLSEDERDDSNGGFADGEEHLLLDSYDHSEFPYTPLDVIEEGSTEENEDDTLNPASIKKNISKEVSVSSKNDERIGSRLEAKTTSTTRDHKIFNEEEGSSSQDQDGNVRSSNSIFSLIGIIRIVFVSALLFQCGTMIDLWEQIADQVRTIDGGPEIITAAEHVVSDLKASGFSLVTTAQGMVDTDSIGDIFNDIESQTTLWIAIATQFMNNLDLNIDVILGNTIVSEEPSLEDREALQLEHRQNMYRNKASLDVQHDLKLEEDSELQLFQQLVDEALGCTDDTDKTALKLQLFEQLADEALGSTVDMDSRAVSLKIDASEHSEPIEDKSDWIQELEDSIENTFEDAYDRE